MEMNLYFTDILEVSTYYSDKTVSHVSELMRKICMILENERIYSQLRYKNYGTRIAVQCTKSAYDRFSEVVDTLYPGMCIFNVN